MAAPLYMYFATLQFCPPLGGFLNETLPLVCCYGDDAFWLPHA